MKKILFFPPPFVLISKFREYKKNGNVHDWKGVLLDGFYCETA